MCVNHQSVCEKTQLTEIEIKSRKMSHPCTNRKLQRSPPIKIIALFPRWHFSQVMMCFILFQYFFIMVETVVIRLQFTLKCLNIYTSTSLG